MRIRLQQLNPTIGDIEANSEAVKAALEEAGESGIDLLILPELVVCGYPPMDLLERVSFREAIYRANDRIVSATSAGSTALLFGSVRDNPSEFGRKCFNAALLAEGGELKGEVHKTLLPTYDVFDDLRYFEPNSEFHCMEFQGVKLGITICEDIWYNENDIQYHTYEVNPARELVEQGAEAIINISGSPFTRTKPENRLEMLRHHAERLKVPIFYANQVGANTELVFDGDTMVLDSKGEVVARCPLFEEAFVDVEWKPGEVKDEPEKLAGSVAEEPAGPEGIFKALVKGLSDYLAKTGISEKVILGLSGGIDSALVACIAAEALGAEKVIGLTMPSGFSSEGSISDSVALAENLGIELHKLPVKKLYDQYLDTLGPLFKDTSFGVAEENLQPRIRAALLMAVANKFGYMLLNTGNKSELATGYCTLYGDMAGGLALINDLYKTEVYEVARWLNDSYYKAEVIPANIIEKPPSAELRPGQKDSDTLPDYDILDQILKLYIEQQLSVKEITGQGYPEDTVRSVVSLVDRNEYKRFQAVPGLKISTKAFGSGRRWPIVQKWSEERGKS